MNPRELTAAAIRGDDLAVRQIVKDARRVGFSWSKAPPPDFSYPRARAVYAGIVEHLAIVTGCAAPEWTHDVGAAPGPVYFDPAAKRSPAMRRWLSEESPAPLKERNVFALSQYLNVL